LSNEVRYLLRLSTEYNLRQFGLDPSQVLPEIKDISGSVIPSEKSEIPAHYEKIKLLQEQIFNYGAEIQKHELSEREAGELNRLLHAARYAVAAAKSIKDIRHNLDAIEEEGDKEHFTGFQNRLIHFVGEIKEIVTRPNEAGLTEKLFEAGKSLKVEDRKYTDSITGMLNSNQANHMILSDLLAVNRNLTLSGRQVVLSVKDLLLSSEAAQVFEHLDV